MRDVTFTGVEWQEGAGEEGINLLGEKEIVSGFTIDKSDSLGSPSDEQLVGSGLLVCLILLLLGSAL